jgi:hypothetical protein
MRRDADVAVALNGGLASHNKSSAFLMYETERHFLQLSTRLFRWFQEANRLKQPHPVYQNRK